MYGAASSKQLLLTASDVPTQQVMFLPKLQRMPNILFSVVRAVVLLPILLLPSIQARPRNLKHSRHIPCMLRPAFYLTLHLLHVQLVRLLSIFFKAGLVWL